MSAQDDLSSAAIKLGQIRIIRYVLAFTTPVIQPQPGEPDPLDDPVAINKWGGTNGDPYYYVQVIYSDGDGTKQQCLDNDYRNAGPWKTSYETPIIESDGSGSQLQTITGPDWLPQTVTATSAGFPSGSGPTPTGTWKTVDDSLDPNCCLLRVVRMIAA